MAIWKSGGLIGLAVAVLGGVALFGQAPARGQLQGWSEWKRTLVERRDARSQQRSFVWDDRFEYRWKKEWSDSGYACAVEIRPAGEADRRYQLAEVDLMYEAPEFVYASADAPVFKRVRQMHTFSTSGVSIDKGAHAGLNAGDCGRVVAVAAGRFSPEISIPAAW